MGNWSVPVSSSYPSQIDSSRQFAQLINIQQNGGSTKNDPHSPSGRGSNPPSISLGSGQENRELQRLKSANKPGTGEEQDETFGAGRRPLSRPACKNRFAELGSHIEAIIQKWKGKDLPLLPHEEMQVRKEWKSLTQHVQELIGVGETLAHLLTEDGSLRECQLLGEDI